MLRLSRWVDGDVEILSLEGKLLAPWHAVLLDELRAEPHKRRIGQLHLANLTFVDAGGAELLRTLQREGIELIGASAFIRALIDQGIR